MLQKLMAVCQPPPHGPCLPPIVSPAFVPDMLLEQLLHGLANIGFSSVPYTLNLHVNVF